MLAGGGGTYVPTLNFKYSCSASLGVGHVPLVLNPFLCLLSPVHPVICRCFKAMSLVGLLP